MRSRQVIDGHIVQRPNRVLWLAEAIRAPRELAAFWATFPVLALGPRGDGHPVLVLPGLLADDESTAPLRAIIAARGLRAVPWEMGPNVGPSAQILTAVPGRIEQLHERSGQTVSLVGWSLGGMLAREFARRCPEHVRDVVTLGSPFRLRAGDRPDLTYAGGVYRALRPLRDASLEDLPRELARAGVPCPSTSIYSRTDGVVPWRACLEAVGPTHENVEVPASHSGLGFNPLAVAVVLDRLVQPEGEWGPYAGPTPARARV
jgi:hypothetical protein